jgi:hypothetical protein
MVCIDSERASDFETTLMKARPLDAPNLKDLNLTLPGLTRSHIITPGLHLGLFKFNPSGIGVHYKHSLSFKQLA